MTLKRPSPSVTSSLNEKSGFNYRAGALADLESHLRLAEARLQRYREDPSRGRDAFEVLDRLAARSDTPPRPMKALTDFVDRIVVSLRLPS